MGYLKRRFSPKKEQDKDAKSERALPTKRIIKRRKKAGSMIHGSRSVLSAKSKKSRNHNQYRAYTSKLYNDIDQAKTLKRAMSERPIRLKGRTYQFHMVDIGKYGNKVKYGVFNWPVRFTSVGPVKAARRAQKKAMLDEVHFDTLYKMLKQCDWAKTIVYDKYTQYGRWNNEDEETYSEIELRYLKTSLRHMTNDIAVQEFDADEGKAIVQKHWDKVFMTLERLMTQMNMLYFFEKLRLILPSNT